MTKSLFKLIGLIVLFGNCRWAFPQISLLRTFANTSLSSGIGGFVLYTPTGYNTSDKYYPLLIVSHGQGENGNGSDPFTAITTNGPLKEIRLGNSTIPGLYDQFIILAPQFKGYPVTSDYDSCISYAKRNFRVRGRTFSTGLSQGGGGVWNSATNSITVTKLAAIVPICGASSPVSKNIKLIVQNNLPVWTFHGTADPTVDVNQSVAWITSINGFVPTINPLAKITTFLGVGHDSWTQVYAGYTESNVNIYEWMVSYDKSPRQTIVGAGSITNKYIGETFSMNATATSNLSVGYRFVSQPDAGVLNYLSGNTFSCTGIGVVTITAFQDGNATYRAAADVVSIFTVLDYVESIVGMPANNAQVKYNSPPIGLSGGSPSNPIQISVSTNPPTSVVSVSGNDIYILGVGNATLTGILNNQTTTSVFSVVPSPLTITSSNFSKIYGSANPIFSGSVLGLKTGDILSISYFTNANNTSGIGNYAIIPSVTGSALSNYQLTTVAGILTIQKKGLNVSVSNSTKIYGQANPSFTGTISGLVNGDVVSANYLTSANSFSGIGNYAIVPYVTGSSLANYQLTTVAGTLTIQKKALSARAFNAYKIVGVANPLFTGTISGLLNGDNVSISYFSTATSLSGIGEYSIIPSVSGSSLVNYQLTTFAGLFQILDKAPLIVTVFNQSKSYKTANPILTGTFSGLASGDDIQISYYTSATINSNTGSYVIYPSITGLSLSGYYVVSNTGMLSINKIPLEIRANNSSKIYGTDNPIFTGTVIGLASGELIDVDYYTDPISGIGEYAIRPSITGVSLSNYFIITVAGLLSVSKADLLVISSDAEKIYGQSNPDFQSSVTGIIDGDLLNIGYQTSANQFSKPGLYEIKPTISGSSISNYLVSVIGSELTIKKAILTITAVNQTLSQSEYPFTPFVYSIQGFVNQDSESDFTQAILIGSFPELNSLTGIYILTVSGAASESYDFDYISGSLIVVKDSSVTQSQSFPDAYFKIYPNPSTGDIYIQTRSSGVLEVFNLLGKKLGSFSIDDDYRINIPEKGLYFLWFYANNQSVRKMVIVE